MPRSSAENNLVAVVDDDDGFLSSVLALLRVAGWRANGYASAYALIEADVWSSLRCVVADVHMPGMTGVDLQEWIKHRRISVPLIIVTGRADVSTAVRAMKAGATDFLEKPFEADALLSIVELVVDTRSIDEGERWQRDETLSRYALLTPRERDVFEALLAGQINKEIAFRLGISARTVEVHRARVMQKMKARNGAQLVDIALRAGLGRKAPDREFPRSRVSRGEQVPRD